MATVSVEVNGRPYSVGCADGQEDRVRQLARTFDECVRQVARDVGSVGDLRLFLMGALLLVAALLSAAAGLAGLGVDRFAAALMAAAMGAENAVFAANGEVRIGLTYMTGTLVKLGQGIAEALLGRSRFGWTPYLKLWFGLVLGGLSGALAYNAFGLAALWGAAVAAAAFAALAARIASGEDEIPAAGPASRPS